MRLAVVGDVHGHLGLMYAILGRWQRETGHRLDLVLQAGDLGSFRPGVQLDRATRRHAARDPEELGFGEFAGPTPPATRCDPRPPLVFIPGNHEDFGFLDDRERAAPAHAGVYPVSEDGLILALRSGRVWTFAAGDDRIRIAGVSGVAQRAPKRHQHPRLHLREDDVAALMGGGTGRFDLLLTHDGPTGVWAGAWRGRGSDALRVLIDEAQPALAFFGHYDRAGNWRVGRTGVYALAGCGYEPRDHWPVKQGGIAILTWAAGRADVERLETPWLAEARRGEWTRWT